MARQGEGIDMDLKNCDTLDILNKNLKLTEEDFHILLYKADTRDDFITQAYIEKQLAIIHGRDFFTQSAKRIEGIIYLIAHKKDKELYDFYIKSFKAYMNSVDNNIEQIMGFNIVFIAFIGIARRTLRKSAELYAPFADEGDDN